MPRRFGEPVEGLPTAVSGKWVEVWVAVVVMSAIIATASILIRGGQGAGVFLIALCTGAVLVAAGFDAATGRIPNPITYTAILLGLSVNSLGMVLRRVAPGVAAHWLGAAGPTQALLGLLVFGGIGMVCLLLAGMGGGDMKLLAAVGAMLGLSRAADALACGVAVAVVYAVINLVLSGRLDATVRAAAVQMLNLAYLRDRSSTAAHARRTIPLAVRFSSGLF